jgi:F0F1-type ATP synthase membrane subunit b/b'
MTETGTSGEGTKDEYHQQAQTALDKLKGQLDELRVQADLAQAEARDRLGQGIEALRKRQGDAKVKLDEAQKAGAGAWKNVAKQTEQVVDELGDTFSKLAGEVQSAAGAAGAAASKGRDAFLEEWKRMREGRTKLLDE